MNNSNGLTSVKTTNHRKSNVDVAKYIASILVVAIHTNPLESFNPSINFIFKEVICRLAVPFFIVCSGYFLSEHLIYENGYLTRKQENLSCFKRQIKKITALYIGWSLLYLLVSIPNWIETGWFSAWAFVDWAIAFLIKGSYYHLWYLLCMIYAMPVLYFILRKVKYSYLPVISIILYSIEVLEYGYQFFLPDSLSEIFRLFDIIPCPLIAVTRGLPFLILGVVISREENEEGILKNIVGFISSFIALILEAGLLQKLGQEKFSYIIFSLPVAYFAFKLLLSCDYYVHFRHSALFSLTSTAVYLVHPAIMWVITLFVDMQPLFLFGFTVCISTMIGIIYCEIKTKCRKSSCQSERDGG